MGRVLSLPPSSQPRKNGLQEVHFGYLICVPSNWGILWTHHAWQRCIGWEQEKQTKRTELHLGVTVLPLMARQNAQEFPMGRGEPCLRHTQAWVHFKSCPIRTLTRWWELIIKEGKRWNCNSHKGAKQLPESSIYSPRRNIPKNENLGRYPGRLPKESSLNICHPEGPHIRHQ